MTPVTETYNQRGKAKDAIFLCNVYFDERAKANVINTIGSTIADRPMCEVKTKKYIGLINPVPEKRVSPWK